MSRRVMDGMIKTLISVPKWNNLWTHNTQQYWKRTLDSPHIHHLTQDLVFILIKVLPCLFRLWWTSPQGNCWDLCAGIPMANFSGLSGPTWCKSETHSHKPGPRWAGKAIFRWDFENTLLLTVWAVKLWQSHNSILILGFMLSFRFIIFISENNTWCNEKKMLHYTLAPTLFTSFGTDMFFPSHRRLYILSKLEGVWERRDFKLTLTENFIVQIGEHIDYQQLKQNLSSLMSVLH